MTKTNEIMTAQLLDTFGKFNDNGKIAAIERLEGMLTRSEYTDSETSVNLSIAADITANSDIDEADTALTRVQTLCSLGERICNDIWSGGRLDTTENHMIHELEALLESMVTLIEKARKPLQQFCK